jgi:hypothetical protein
MNVEPRAAIAIVPISVTNAGTATGAAIDCKGYDRAHIVIEASASNAVTNKETVLKLQESATTDATNFSDVSGFVGGTDFTIPDAETTVTKPRAMLSVDLTKNRKRYLRVLASPVTTVVYSGTAILTKGEESPSTTAKANVGILVRG